MGLSLGYVFISAKGPSSSLKLIWHPMIASTYVFRPLILKISTGAFYYPEHTVFLEVDVQSLIYWFNLFWYILLLLQVLSHSCCERILHP